MPHLRIRGIEESAILESSKEIVDGLTDIIKCDRNWFTLEHLDTKFIFDGKYVTLGTFIEIQWFPRSKEVKDSAATFLTNLFKRINGDRDVTVIFIPLEGENYYDNGTHF